MVRSAASCRRGLLPEGDGYLAAIINFRYIANALWAIDEAVERIEAAS